MSGSGSPEVVTDATGARIAIIAGLWHELVSEAMLASAKRTCSEAGAEVIVFRVPGSFELPLAARAAAEAGFDAIVALGVIIRGGTPHFEYVSDATTSGLAQVALTSGVPVGFGVLTCDNEQQALDRAGLPDSPEDKGAEAAQAALMMLSTLAAIGVHDV